MKELDTKVTHIETRVTEVENSSSFINDKHEKQTDELTIVNSINVRMKELNTKVTHIETRVTEVENSSSFINDKHEKQTDELKHAQTEVKNLQLSCKDLEENM